PTPRVAALTLGPLCAILSILLFATTTGLLALDVTDQWANNIGIVASAVLMSIFVIWVFRRGPELRHHLNAVSTFKVGRIWVLLVGLVAPVVLGYMLISRIITLLVDGYEGYPAWYLGLFGWGTVALIVVLAIVAWLIPWRESPDDFAPWPPLPEASADTRTEVTR